MSAKEKYLSLEKVGENIFSIYTELKKTNDPLKAMVLMREMFPELSLIQAKEIMVLSETDYTSLRDYQKNILQKTVNKI
jgi:hypothetical protein